MADFAPTHPGEILLTEFLEPMGICSTGSPRRSTYLPSDQRDRSRQARNHRRHRAAALARAGTDRYVLHQHAGALRR